MRPMTPHLSTPELSVVVPMHNESGNAAALVREIATACADIDHEILAVDDASTDDTLAELQSAKEDIPQLRILSHTDNAGQSRAVRSGVLAAKSDTIATLDGDGQNPPSEIPKLYAHLKETGVALVGGERQKRQDSPTKLLASRIGNGVRRRLLHDTANDTGCGLKVFDRDAFLRLPYFDHIHRYLPALMIREGYRIDFLPVAHRAREHGASKYTNLGRLKVSIADLRGVRWLNKRARLPGEVREL